MKAVILTMAVILSAGIAKADGFVCTSESGVIARVYNHTDADMGTRTAAVMILSDDSINVGRRTTAKFTDVNSTLSSYQQTYVAKVDLRYSDSDLKGRNIAGTKLGFVDLIILSVDFSYGAPVAHGTQMPGTLTVIKRNGEELIETATCTRYLKN